MHSVDADNMIFVYSLKSASARASQSQASLNAWSETRQDETAREMGRDVVGIYSNTEKVLRLVLVMKEMGASGLHPFFLAIGMQLFLAPRVLRRDGHHVLPRAQHHPSLLA